MEKFQVARWFVLTFPCRCFWLGRRLCISLVPPPQPTRPTRRSIGEVATFFLLLFSLLVADADKSVRHTKPFDQPGAGEPWWQCVIDVLGKFEADGGP